MKKLVVMLSIVTVAMLPLLSACAKKDAEAPKTEQAPVPAAPVAPEDQGLDEAAPDGQAPASGDAGTAPSDQPAEPAAN